jgi:hypothetical protein
MAISSFLAAKATLRIFYFMNRLVHGIRINGGHKLSRCLILSSFAFSIPEDITVTL